MELMPGEPIPGIVENRTSEWGAECDEPPASLESPAVLHITCSLVPPLLQAQFDLA